MSSHRMHLSKAAGLLFCLALRCSAWPDELPTTVSNQNRTGPLPFSTTVGTEIEHVDIASGNLMVRIPIAGVAGRGMGYSFVLPYDAQFLVAATRTGAYGPYQVWEIENRPSIGLGWGTNTAYYTRGTQTLDCEAPWPPYQMILHAHWMYHDPEGGKHPLAIQRSVGQSCGSFQDSPGPDLTGEGMSADIVASQLRVKLSDGTVATVPYYPASSWASNWTDPNGNIKGEGADGADTLGRVIVTQQGTPPNQTLYRVYDSNGVWQTYTVNFTTINLVLLR